MRNVNLDGPDALRPRYTPILRPNDAAAAGALHAPRPAGGGDRVELSDAARRLIGDPGASDCAARARVEAARRKLESGELFTPKVINETAERLLLSGDLDRDDA